jgi:predicted CXXCH cytochrome family protein
VHPLLLAAAAGCVLAVAASLAPVAAQDPPHWLSTSLQIDCTSQCHTPHQAPGGRLTAAAGNVNLCQSCHNSAGLAAALPLDNADAAVPGVSGSSHAFDAPALNPSFDTQLPLDPEMALRVMDGNVVCSTCHNQHKADAAHGGTPKVSPPVQVTALGSTGAVASGGTWTGAEGVWYLLEISRAGTEANARFRYSKDNGISFFPEQSTGVDVPLDSGVTVSFGAGDYVLGERWELYASWPFLRADLDAAGAGSVLCRDCHRAWDMDHTAVETWDGTFKSHPVGVSLGASGSGFDRPVPLDGNGAEQGTAGADANPSNDLTFDANGDVQCLTCHGVHFVDSNTLTADAP